MPLSKKQLLIAAGIIVVAVALFLIIRANLQGPLAFTQVELKVWGIDSEDAFQGIQAAYQALRPQVKITYTRVAPANYKNAVLNALAAGQGPDVIYVSNHDVAHEEGKLAPLNPLQLGDVRIGEIFPRSVTENVVSHGQVYALPLYIDSLALIYNKDLFDQRGVVYPPKTWREFTSAVGKLGTVDARGRLVRSAAAIGGTEKNIDTAADLLELLMMQNSVAITETYDSLDSLASPKATEAFEFYLQFSDVTSPYYTWNEDQENSVDSFAAGKTAMLFNYQSAIPTITRKNPFLSVGVSLIPQASDELITYPTYYALAVAKQSKSANTAWDFVTTITTRPEIARLYYTATGRPPALRSLIADLIDDPSIGAFARSALITRTWYEANGELIKQALNNAIKDVRIQHASPQSALRKASEQMKGLYGARDKR